MMQAETAAAVMKMIPDLVMMFAPLVVLGLVVEGEGRSSRFPYLCLALLLVLSPLERSDVSARQFEPFTIGASVSKAPSDGLHVGKVTVLLLVHAKFHRSRDLAKVPARLRELRQVEVVVQSFLTSVGLESSLSNRVSPSRPVPTAPC